MATNRIVPMKEQDLVTMYGVVLAAAAAAASGTAPENLDVAGGEPGVFDVSTNSKTYLASEPLKTLNFGSSVTASTIYFVPALDYKGFTKTGATLTGTDTVVADGHSLWSATLSTNAVTYAKIGI